MYGAPFGVRRKKDCVVKFLRLDAKNLRILGVFQVVNCRTFASPWGNEDTQTLIDILEKFHVKTTFFVVGDWADKYP